MPAKTVSQTLILFNDELSGKEIDVHVAMKVGTQVIAQCTKRITTPLGEHMEFPCTFTVPTIAKGLLSLELSTSKQGVIKFREDRFYNVTGASTAAPKITLGAPTPCYSTTCVETAVDFIPTPKDGAGHGIIRVTAHNKLSDANRHFYDNGEDIADAQNRCTPLIQHQHTATTNYHA